jgi:hypothetical protein
MMSLHLFVKMRGWHKEQFLTLITRSNISSVLDPEPEPEPEESSASDEAAEDWRAGVHQIVVVDSVQHDTQC